MLVTFAAEAAPQSILVLGDSLSAAYGIGRDQGWVALLGKRLEREGFDYRVVNGSISGDTTAGGRARLGRSLAQHKPAIVILELGGNDGLRGLQIAEMKRNLAAMIEAAQQSGAKVLLVGMKLPPNYGPQYTDAFESAYGELAKRYRIGLVPFLLEDFAEQPQLFQDDRIHPTAAAQPLMLERVWQGLRPLLRK